MLIHDFLKDSAAEFKDKIAVVHQDRKATYKELDESSGNFAGTLLDKGVEKGDRVVLFLDNSCDYLIAYFGILKVGAIIVALNSQLVARELNVLLDDCSPKIIITDKKHSKVAEEALVSCVNPASLLLIENVNQCSSSSDQCLSSDQCSLGNNHEPSAISHELSDSALNPEACNHGPSTISYRLLTCSLQPVACVEYKCLQL